MDKQELYELSDRLIKRAKADVVDKFELRSLYKLVNERDSKIIIGPRRIGKTTLLEAILRKYTEEYGVQITSMEIKGSPVETISFNGSKPVKIANNVKIIKPPLKVMYLKLDALEFSSMDKEELQAVQKVIRDSIIDDEFDLLLLDEIQMLPNWIYLIKDIKDMSTKDVRIVGTGSNSNELMKSVEHGIGRYSVGFYGVLSLKEFKDIKGIKNLDLENYRKYVEFNHFPHYNESRYRDEVSSAVIEKAFSASTKDKTNTFKVLKWINNNPGSEISPTRIARESEIDRKYINNYISELQAGQLIYKLANRNSKTIKKKVYTLIPGAFTLFDGKALLELSKEKQGAHFENFVLLQLLSLTHTMAKRITWEYIKTKESKGPSEIDFVYGQTGFEVKSTLNGNHKKYIQYALSKGLKTLYFVHKNGPSPRAFEVHGINVKYLRWDDFADEKYLNKLKSDLGLNK